MHAADHMAGPHALWEYALVALAVVVLVWVLYKAVKYTFWPGEEEPDHIKRKILEDEAPSLAVEVAPPVPEAERLHGFASGGIHEVAERYGFHRADVDGETILYCHPERGDLFAYRDRSWEHVSAEGGRVCGTGMVELRNHLVNLMRKKG